MSQVVFAKDDMTGRTWPLHAIDDDTFGTLNESIAGLPIYFNRDKVWPNPEDGVSVIWQQFLPRYEAEYKEWPDPFGRYVRT